MINLICMGCNKPFSRNSGQHNQNIKRGRIIIACSPECVHKARYPEGYRIITFNCLCCNKEVSRKRTSKDKMMYCSLQCSSKMNPHHTKANREPKICVRCDAVEISRKAKYCSDCKKPSGTPRRDLSKVTLGELRSKYSISQYHAKIRGWSRGEYARSGKPMDCFSCGYSLHVDICHIKDVKDFTLTSTIAEVNHIDNLIALCKNHHWEFDNSYLDL